MENRPPNPPEPEQQSESPGSWMYRRVRAVFEASHRAPDRADVLLPGSAATDEIIDLREDENDSNQQEEETHSDMTDESLDVPDARQVSSDSETSNAPSDNTSHADLASGSTRVTDMNLKMSGNASKSRQVDSHQGLLEVTQQPQGGRGAPRTPPNETRERNSTNVKAPSAIQKPESRASTEGMIYISQNNVQRNSMDGKVGRLVTKKSSPEEPFQISCKYLQGNLDLPRHF